MCIQDWRLGRLIRASHSMQSPTIIAPFTLQRNHNRVGVLAVMETVTTSTAATLLITIDGVNIGLLSIQSPTLMMTLATYGDLPTQQIVFTGPALGFDVGITEFFLPEKTIQAGLEEYNRENV